jgi:hypothetical protein
MDIYDRRHIDVKLILKLILEKDVIKLWLRIGFYEDSDETRCTTGR